jgi:hypothetical protein
VSETRGPEPPEQIETLPGRVDRSRLPRMTGRRAVIALALQDQRQVVVRRPVGGIEL